MAKDDWTVVSETPATSGWEVVSQTPVKPAPVERPSLGLPMGETLGAEITAAAGPAKEGPGFLEQLKKSFVEVGIPQTEAGFKGLTVMAQADRIAKTADQLKALEASGQGESKEASGLRKTLDFYTKRQGEYFKDLATKQAELSKAPVYAGVRKLSEAKTFSEGFKTFAEDPVNIVANLTAQSLPSVVPGLVMGVINPALGAATMGGSSFGVEFGGSLLEFARDSGFDTSDPNQMAEFFANKDLLREGINKAGTRAGIVGAGDLFLAGLASKTLVPKRITGPVAKNVTNVGAQMGAQAVGGGGFEALAQLATEGEIKKPGEVLAEAFGELGGAPAEVFTQTRAAAREARKAREEAAAAPKPAAPAERIEPTFEPEWKVVSQEPAVPPEAPAAPSEAGVRAQQALERLAESVPPRAATTEVPIEEGVPSGIETPEAIQAEEEKPEAPAAVGRPGYDTPLTVNAADLKAAFERDSGESIVTSPAKLEAWRAGTAKTDPARMPPEVAVRKDGTIGINDGRHRIALAAERGEDITVYVDKNDAEKLQQSIASSRAAKPEAPKAASIVEKEQKAPAAPAVTPTTRTEAVEQHAVQGLPVVEAPIENIQLSEEVPQFKSDADVKGIVEPLEGKFERTGVAPIQLWRRKDGRLEVISGRHRFDLAKRSGEATIPAQIHDEAAGFDATKAATLDAELNIRDGQGKVKDYVVYFDKSGITRDEAESRGLLARPLGKRAWRIASEGSPELIAAHRADVVDDTEADAIAAAAPGNARLQAVGIKAIQSGKKAAAASNLMRAVSTLAIGREPVAEGADLFGFDESAMKEAEDMANVATRKQSELDNRLRAIQGAARRPEVAKAEGVDVKDPEAVRKRIDELKRQRSAWDNWSTNPELVNEIRRELRPEMELTAPTEAELRAEAERTAEEERRRRAEAEAPPPEEFTLTGSERAADEAAARGQRELEEAEEKTLPEVTVPGAKTNNKQLETAIDENDWAAVTEQLAKSKNPLISAVGNMAKKLIVGTQINWPFAETKQDKAYGKMVGAYGDGNIYIRAKKYAGNEHVVAHEAVHALTIDAIRNPTKAQQAAVNRLKNLYRYVKTRLPEQRLEVSGKALKVKMTYGLRNEEEFIAEGMSNPEFQKELAQLPYKNQTAWGAFTKAIADVLGIKDQSALTELIALTEELSAKPATEGKAAPGEVVGISLPEEDRPEGRAGLPRQKESLLVSRDELGRRGFGAGAKTYDAVAKIANAVLDKVSMKPISPELSRAMRNMKAVVAKAQKEVAGVAGELGKLPEAERKMVSDVIEGELKAGVHPPQHVLNIAASMQDIMLRQSEELVRLKMLSPEAAARWENKYLPRFYETKLRDDINAWSNAVKKLLGRQPVMRGIRGAQLKSRGMYEVISADDLPNWIAEGWEQRDPSFDPKTSTETVVWRDYTREEREKMGEIRDAMFRFVMGYNASQRDIALGRLYEELARDYASPAPQEGYVRVPDTEIEGTMASRYGALSGMYVPKEIFDHLVANDEALANGVLKIYRAALRKWKEGKTVLNPVSHANNIISNLTMAHFAGVSYWDGQKYAGAIRDLVKNDPMVKEAEDIGLFGGTFNQSELVDSMPPELRALANKTESQAAKIGEGIWDLLAYSASYKGKKYGVRPVMQWAYDAEDQFFRYLIYRDARQKGLDPEDAREYSQQFIFTYDDLPAGARALRDYGMPFFGYTYKVVPVLARTALEYPWRYAAPAAVAYAANAMMYSMAASLGGNDDDWWGKTIARYVTDPEFRKKVKDMEAEERRKLPEWMKGHSAILATPKAIRMGVDEATGLPLFLDISRIFPGGDLLDANNNSGGVALLQPLTPSNPVLTTLVAMLANKDMFYGKDVVKASDTEAQKARKRADWLWKQITPAISVGNYHFDRGMNVLANMTGKKITIDAGPMGVVNYTGVGKDGLPVQPKYALAQTFGIKVRPYDLEISERIEEANKAKLIKEISAEISQLNRLESKGAISPEVAEKLREEARVKRTRLKEGLTVEGKEKD